MNNNPLLAVWNTPHQTPPFASIRPEHFLPAIEEAIKLADANLATIIDCDEAPSFVNTILPIEHITDQLDRITSLLFNLDECDTSPELHEAVVQSIPLIVALESRIATSKPLFARVAAVQALNLDLSTEDAKLLEQTYKGFVRQGVALSEEKQKQLMAIDEELAQLTQQFSQNTLDDTNEFTLHITNESDLQGLPVSAVDTARQEASDRQMEGWLFTLQAPSYMPFLRYADNRDLRRKMWIAYNTRGTRGNEHDNNALILRIANLRQQRANLLGYNTYCDYVLEERMVKSLSCLRQFMQRLHDAALPAARRDLDEVSDFARQQGADLPLQPWDFGYYAEKMKQQRYGFDADAMRPYFQLDRVQQGIFDLYHRLYGLSFKPTSAIEVYHPDTRVFEVYDHDRFMAVLYLDMHPRASKRSGAWMTEFRAQYRDGDADVRPLIQVVCNFSKPVGDQPALLSFDEVHTLMHEFGHAIHGLLSDVTYSSLSCTNVLRDFVELPSQLMENWCYQQEFLTSFATHYQTGEPLPAEYINKIKASQNYLAGYYFIRQLNFGNTDIAFHSITAPLVTSVAEVEQSSITHLLPDVQGTLFSTAFTHIFAGGYASGYYGYKWAEVLQADVFSRFEQEGIFSSETAHQLRDTILSRGGTEHPAILFRNFMHRDPDTQALLRKQGLVIGE